MAIMVNIRTNSLIAEENNHKYMAFEGLGYGEGDEEGESTHDGSVIEAFEEDGVSHR
jgi:hypothetical protein